MSAPPRPDPNRRMSGCAGSLLLEALASLTIGALILGGLVQASGLLLRVLDRSVAHIHDVERLDRAISSLRRDIGQAVRARWAGAEPQAFIFEGTPSRIVFVAPYGDARAGRAGPERVVLVSSLANSSTARVSRTESMLASGTSGPAGLAFGPARDLYEGSARIRFRYVAASGRALEPVEPLPSWPAGPFLPESVLLEAIDPATGRVLLSARAPLRVTADIGCIDPRAGVCGLDGRQEAGSPQAGIAGSGRPDAGQTRPSPSSSDLARLP